VLSENKLVMNKRVFLILFGLLLLIAIALMDFSLGRELFIPVFYLIPIIYFGWFMNRIEVLIASVICGVSNFVSDFIAGIDYSMRWAFYWNEIIWLVCFVGVAVALPILKDAYYKEKKIARTDYLTGAMNSRAFYEKAQQEMERARIYNYPITVAYIDIDNFKIVNDRFGHQVGDDFLRLITKKIKAGVRSFDIVARMGGDEFAVILPEIGLESAINVTERLEKQMVSIMNKNELPLTFSIGVAIFNKPPHSVAELIRKADLLMYVAKSKGKNMVQYDLYDA